jgi:plasmid stability protein
MRQQQNGSERGGEPMLILGDNRGLHTSLIVPPFMEEFSSNPMAVLSIKNFPDSLYRKLRARAKRQHRSVAQEVTHLLSDALERPKPLSILSLKGLGKELHWRGVDPSKHVERERASWD